MKKKIIAGLIACGVFTTPVSALTTNGLGRDDTNAHVTINVNVRRTTSTKYKAIDKLKKNTNVDIIWQNDKWAFIEYGHRKAGYVSTKYIKYNKWFQELFQ